jgi:hypothetical protein
MPQCLPKSALAHSVPLQDTTPVHRRRDHGELALWTAIAILDAAMLVLCTISLKLDPSLTQATVMLVERRLGRQMIGNAKVSSGAGSRH